MKIWYDLQREVAALNDPEVILRRWIEEGKLMSPSLWNLARNHCLI